MKDTGDKLTAELPAFPKRRGRPPSGNAKTDVERAAEYRQRKRSAGGMRITLDAAEVQLIVDSLKQNPQASALIERLEATK